MKGYAQFWSSIFNRFGITMDNNLLAVMKSKDEHKRRKATVSQTKAGKIARSNRKNRKYTKAQKDLMEELKTGLSYESDIARRC